MEILNARGCNRPGATLETVKQLEMIIMNIIEVQEIPRIDTGSQKVTISLVFCRGTLNDRYKFGTEFVLQPNIVNAVIDFKSVTDRICLVYVIKECAIT